MVGLTWKLLREQVHDGFIIWFIHDLSKNPQANILPLLESSLPVVERGEVPLVGFNQFNFHAVKIL